jgi:hypothetical protein
MNRHGLGQAGSRSLATVKIQTPAHAITFNLKRVAPLMQMGAAGAPAAGLAIAGGTKQGDGRTIQATNNPA